MRALLLPCLLATCIVAQLPTPASHDIQVLVKQALDDRLAANDVPDLDLRRFGTVLVIQQDMRRSHLNLTSEALPRLDGYAFSLMSLAELQAEADRTVRDILFLTADQPSIDSDTATISLGTDIVFPKNPKRFKLCCCVGTAQFHKDQTWTFVKWLRLVCS